MNNSGDVVNSAEGQALANRQGILRNLQEKPELCGSRIV